MLEPVWQGKVQSHRDLIDEMKAVARGEKPAPPDAAMCSVESEEVLRRLIAEQTGRRPA